MRIPENDREEIASAIENLREAYAYLDGIASKVAKLEQDAQDLGIETEMLRVEAGLPALTGGPSERALEAAAKAERESYEIHDAYPWRQAIQAAHAPELGLDRSVCLREVIDVFLRP